MLSLHPAPGGGEITRDAIAAAVWVDMVEPTAEEAALVSEALGLAIPTRDALSEIEQSSRLQAEGDVLRLSTPLLAHADTAEQTLTPAGFILSPKVLITVRFTRLRVFDITASLVSTQPDVSAAGVFTLLMEAVADREADVLEHVGAELDALSRALFRVDPAKAGRGGRSDEDLRTTLGTVGQIGDRLSEIRASLLGVARIVPFACEVGAHWLSRDHYSRLNAVRQDLASLGDFEAHLASKVQFLLDAVLGFINTKQNELFKVLTIVSVVGVPPTLIASIYGMNFAHMPELQWRFGYPLAIVLIVASAVLPILWFKWKRWW